MIERFKIELGQRNNEILDVEQQCLHFYRHCIKVSNQFSTKFVMQKVVDTHRNHMQTLLKAVEKESVRITIPDYLKELMETHLLQGVEENFNLESLTFVEANQLGMHLVDNYVGYYQKVLDSEPNPRVREVLENIITIKNSFRAELEEEYNRLRYKKQE